LFATGAQLERICRGVRGALADEGSPTEARSVRRRVLPGGMVKLEIVLAPDEADLVMRAVDCARASKGQQTANTTIPDDVSAETEVESPTWPSRPDGVVALAEDFLAGHAEKGTGGERYQVMVHVDQDPLAPDGTLSATLEDGTRVSAETFRRIACDCGLVAVTGQGEALDIGRRARSIPPAIRRVLRLRDHGCRFPGCTHDRFLHGHHVCHWLSGGETKLDNLVHLCTFHHRLVHEGGWTVQPDGRGGWVFSQPDGTRHELVIPSMTSVDSLAWLQEWAEHRGLDLGPDANLPLWDGTRPDYDLAVGALLAEI
jgi:hypothetical protein